MEVVEGWRGVGGVVGWGKGSEEGIQMCVLIGS